MAGTKEQNQEILFQKSLKQIALHIKDVQYGAVTLIIQNGRIIRIEKLEKIKLEDILE